MFKERKKFVKEIKMLESNHGIETVGQTYLVLSEVLKWLNHFGHGEITLSAIEHRLGKKFRTNTVHTIILEKE